MVHVLAFSGSLRKNSLNTRLLHIAAGMLPDNMTLEIFDLSPIPMYNEDVRQQGYPEAVAEFRSKIRQADALLIASPEYNYSITGVLKNAIDWASRPELDSTPMPLSGKPFGIVGVGGRFGTARGQLHLRQIASALNMQALNKPEVLISNFPQPAFDQEGNLVDQMSIKLLSDLLVGLRNWTLQLKTEPTLA